ncbi:MAG: T9SS C-terminal target domain-containing protein [Candidatus Zixiibacteriota bacterium]|nr:MAG: T9SS C-terminal target domain-containing protein [candidate division Zixibacteria bacterium]
MASYKVSIRIGLTLAVICLALVPALWAQIPLDPTTLDKYIDPLPLPGVATSMGQVQGATYYEITMTEFQQQLHSQIPPTTVWGYNGTFPGPTIEAFSNKKVLVRWWNQLPTDHLLTVDTTVHGAGGVPEVRTVVHLHGGHIPADVDGYPEDWFTPGNYVDYLYPNKQPAATLWYHDHALGITRLNVQAGLAAFYLLRDKWEGRLNLPQGPYEIPVALQDRSFYTSGQLMYPEEIAPEFFGNTAVINGKVWPRLAVEPRKYRFRFLGGANSRFFSLRLFESDSAGNIIEPLVAGPVFWQIGTDGGLLPAPVAINQPGDPDTLRLLVSPGERFDVIIDFAGYQGQYFVLHNNAKSPFKGFGEYEDEEPLPEIMLFEVQDTVVADPYTIPASLRPVIPIPENSAKEIRDLTLEEEEGMGHLLLLLNGMHWDDPITENPQLGSTEIWRILNLTEDVHPIHLHLVQFQILDRQPFDVEAYMEEDTLIFTGPPAPPQPNEMGWKDTFHAFPGTMTRIIQRFQDYPGLFVWHCHILEHEDHEMMRPYEVVTGPAEALAGLVEEPLYEPVMPEAPALHGAHPNPFNPATAIRFQLSDLSYVSLKVYDTAGRQVATVVDGWREAGAHEATFDASMLPSGIYFARMTAGNFTGVQKLALVK